MYPSSNHSTDIRPFTWILIILLTSIIAIQSYPQRRRSIKEFDTGEVTHVDPDDGEAWYPVENANESENPGSAQAPSGSNAGSGNEEMMRAIRDLFQKWGYPLDEVPVPFGTMDPGKPFQSSPEFTEILQALVDKLPPDLEKQLRAILEQARTNSGSMAHEPSAESPSSDVVDGQTCEAELDGPCVPDEDMHTAAWASDHPTVQSSSLWESTFKNPKSKPVTTTSTTPEPEAPTTLSHVDRQLAEIEKMKKENGWDRVQLDNDEKKIDELLEDVKEMMAEDRSKDEKEAARGKAELEEIEKLIHEVEAIAEKNIKAVESGSGPPCHHGHEGTKDPVSKNEQIILREMWKKQNIKPDETSAFDHHHLEDKLKLIGGNEPINGNQMLTEMKNDNAAEQATKQPEDNKMTPQDNGIKHHDHVTLNEKERAEAQAFSNVIQEIDNIARMEAKNIEQKNHDNSRQKLDALIQEIKTMQDSADHEEGSPNQGSKVDSNRMDQVNHILQDLERESGIERELQHKLDPVLHPERHEPHSRDREDEWDGMNIPGAAQHKAAIAKLMKENGWDNDNTDSHYAEKMAKVDEQLNDIRAMNQDYEDRQHTKKKQYFEVDRALAEHMTQVQAMMDHDKHASHRYAETDRAIDKHLNDIRAMNAQDQQAAKHQKDQYAQTDRRLADVMTSIHPGVPSSDKKSYKDRYAHEDRELDELMASIQPEAQSSDKKSYKDRYAHEDRELDELMASIQPEAHSSDKKSYKDRYAHEDRELDELMASIPPASHGTRNSYQKDQFRDRNQYAESDRQLDEMMNDVKALSSKPSPTHKYDDKMKEIDEQLSSIHAMNAADAHRQAARQQEAHRDRQYESKVDDQIEDIKALHTQYNQEKAKHLASKQQLQQDNREDLANVDAEISKIQNQWSPHQNTITMKVHPVPTDHHHQQVEEERQKIHAMTHEAVSRSRDPTMDQVDAILNDLHRSNNEYANIQKLKSMEKDKDSQAYLEQLRNNEKVNDILRGLQGHPLFPDAHSFRLHGPSGPDHEMAQIDQHIADVHRMNERAKYNDQMREIDRIMESAKPKTNRKVVKDKYNAADLKYLNKLRKTRKKTRVT